MERGKLDRKGPSIGTYRDRDIPAWLNARGVHWVYDRIGALDKDGGFEMSQLARDELVIAPGLIYKLETAQSAE